MPPFGPMSRPDLVYYMRKAGFRGPLPGTKHELMTRGSLSIPIPNPHCGDISRDLVRNLLRAAGISREEWEKL